MPALRPHEAGCLPVSAPDSMLKLQDTKLGLAEAALGEGSGTRLQKLSVKQIREVRMLCVCVRRALMRYALCVMCDFSVPVPALFLSRSCSCFPV